MPDLSYENPQFRPIGSSAPLIHSCNCMHSGVPLKGWLDAASGLIVSYELQNYAPTAKRTQLRGELSWHTLCNVIQSNAMFSKHESLCHFVFIYTGLKKKIKHTFKNIPFFIVSLQHHAISQRCQWVGNDSVSVWGTRRWLPRNKHCLFDWITPAKKERCSLPERVGEKRNSLPAVS